MPAKTKWDEIPCPKCKEPMAASASVCPHCTTAFTDAEVSAHKKGFRNSLYLGLGCTTLLVLLVAGCSLGLFAEGEGSPEEKKASVAAYIDGFGDAGKRCDRAYQTRGKEFTSGDLVVVYAAADYVEKECVQTNAAFGRLRVPDNLGAELKEKFDYAHLTCSNAYYAKMKSAELAKKIANGDFSPATQSELRSNAEEGRTKLIFCTGLLVDAAKEVGVDVAEQLGKG